MYCRAVIAVIVVALVHNLVVELILHDHILQQQASAVTRVAVVACTNQLKVNI